MKNARWKKIVIAFLISLFLISPATSPYMPGINAVLQVQAHSGRTDSSGGHHDYKNKSGLGSYHYHHGYPAHLHKNGVCPYSVSNVSQGTDTQQVPTGQSEESRLRTKYSPYTMDYDNKLQSGYFRQDINVAVAQFISIPENMPYLQTLLTPEETVDLSGNNAVQNEILSKIVYMRVYDIILGQSGEQAKEQNIEPKQDMSPAAAEEEDDFLHNLVTQVQTQLKLSGFYGGDVDGIFDLETQQALISFQTFYGLIPDGTIHEQVVAALQIQM